MSGACAFIHLSLSAAVKAIQRGELVIFPTETYFGIGGDAFNPRAVERVFAAKNRAEGHALPVIVPDMQATGKVARHISPLAGALMRAFWPGSLTILFPASENLPCMLTGNTGEVAARLSPHPAATALCKACAAPIIASSANLSGNPPAAYEEGLDPAIVSTAAGIYAEGPAPQGGAPSTVVRLVMEEGIEGVRIARPGKITSHMLAAAGFTVL